MHYFGCVIIIFRKRTPNIVCFHRKHSETLIVKARPHIRMPNNDCSSFECRIMTVRHSASNYMCGSGDIGICSLFADYQTFARASVRMFAVSDQESKYSSFAEKTHNVKIRSTFRQYFQILWYFLTNINTKRTNLSRRENTTKLFLFISCISTEVHKIKKLG